jgi:hypothetical protein
MRDNIILEIEIFKKLTVPIFMGFKYYQHHNYKIYPNILIYKPEKLNIYNNINKRLMKKNESKKQ